MEHCLRPADIPAYTAAFVVAGADAAAVVDAVVADVALAVGQDGVGRHLLHFSPSFER